ncbi:LysM peptidoglycan-binding domain-containing protein [Streptomyces yerevanensis]|uniref:CIS tube protein n=1 Tax=Streptomyces yerevanensis TaxID=66378 RepID=UPI000525E5C5|nr:LysM peptidoglycan-binding domain-containing protein [Streptomyces yerevanensis]
MTSSPDVSSAQGAALNRATLTVTLPGDNSPSATPLLKLPINPTEYAVSKGVNYQEIEVLHLDSPPLQYLRGGARILKLDALVDTSEAPKGPARNVQTEYLDAFQKLTLREPKAHMPPVVTFKWGSNPEFTGVIESLAITYVLFDREGTPTRAKVSLSLKEFTAPKTQQQRTPTSSPTVPKVWTVRRGDTLSSIAAAVYRDSGRWRELASANGLADPRALTPGTALVVPALGRG